MNDLLAVLVRGAQAGSLYAFPAIGLSMVYGVTGAFSLAHGEFVLLGAVGALVAWSGFGLPLLLSGLVAVCCAAVFSVLVGRLTILPVLGRESPTYIVSTLGVATVMTAVMATAMTKVGNGADTQRVPSVAPFDGTWRWGSVILNTDRLFPVAALVVVAAALAAVMRLSRFGLAFAAISDDPEAAAMRGINVGVLTLVTFAIAGALAAFGGFVAAPVTLVSAYGGLALVLRAFVGLTIGGIGSINGAIVGSFVVGVLDNLTVRYVDAKFQDPVILVCFLLILLVRPQGLAVRTVRSV